MLNDILKHTIDRVIRSGLVVMYPHLSSDRGKLQHCLPELLELADLVAEVWFSCLLYSLKSITGRKYGDRIFLHLVFEK